MDKLATDLVLQTGALGLLTIVVVGIGYFLSRLDKKLSVFLVNIEETHKALAKALIQMQRDNALHYERDSYEQKAIADALFGLRNHITEEHRTTRLLIARRSNDD